MSGLVGSALLIAGIIGALNLAQAQAASVKTGGSCSANTQYTLPSALDLSGSAAGLTVTDSGISTYGVGGSSIAMVRDALNRCAPGFDGSNRSGEFLAYTSYTVNWSYTVVSDGTTCHLANVKVGLHLSQLLPRLDSDGGNTTVTSKWQSFINGLQTHENGHTAVDIAQARTMLSALQSLNAPCSTIDA